MGEIEDRAMARLRKLLSLQADVEKKFGCDDDNVFVFGSYVTDRFIEGESDVDIAIYSEDFGLYTRLACYLEEYFRHEGIDSDIFFIDLSMQAPIYCAPLNSQVQFTDYYPQKLIDFKISCQRAADEARGRMAG